MKADWKLVELGSLAEPSPNSMVDGPFGSNLKTSDYIDTGVPLIRIQNVRPDGFLNKGTRFISEAKAASLSRHAFRPGDIVIAKLGDQPGVACVVPESAGKGVIVADIVRMRPDVRRVDPSYICHFLNSPSAQQGLGMVTKGTTRQRINLGSFKQLVIPLPPLPEQRRIAAILNQAEALRTKRRAALTKLDSLVHSHFIDLFGDPRKNEKRWPIRRIETLISDMRGGASLEPDDFVDEGFPILHKGAIKPNGLISVDAKKRTFAPMDFASTHPRNQVDRGYVAVTLRDLVPSGPSIGLAADLRKATFDKYLLAQGAYAFRLDPHNLLPDYFVWLSNMPNFRHVLRQNAVGSTQIHIRTPIYLAIKIPIPPIGLQRAFAQSIEEVERIKSGQIVSMARLDGLIASLQHRAFRGEL